MRTELVYPGEECVVPVLQYCKHYRNHSEHLIHLSIPAVCRAIYSATSHFRNSQELVKAGDNFAVSYRTQSQWHRNLYDVTTQHFFPRWFHRSSPWLQILALFSRLCLLLHSYRPSQKIYKIREISRHSWKGKKKDCVSEKNCFICHTQKIYFLQPWFSSPPSQYIIPFPSWNSQLGLPKC